MRYVAVLLLCSTAAVAQCLNGTCAPVGVPAVPVYAAPARPVAPPEWSFQRHPTEPGQVMLYRFGKLVGGWREKDNILSPLRDDGDFVPADQIAGLLGRKAPVTDYGVDSSKINPAPTYHINGRPATREEQFTKIAGQLVDDSAKDFLVFVGAKDIGAALSAAWKSDKLASLRDKYHLQVYETGAVMARVRGYTADGLYCATCAGKVLGVTSFSDADSLLDWLNKLRNPTPAPKPAPTPGPVPPSPDTPFNVPAWLWALAGAILGSLLHKKDPAK